MSIAEQIMLGTQQQSKNWSVLSENLGRLGQQVGQQLAMREYQKQAAEALPAMQAAYKSAMDDVAAGQVTEGYKKFMDAQFQFGASQNPLIANQNALVSDFFIKAADTREKQLQRQAQYGGRFAPSRMPTDEEMLSDTFGTDTMVEGDGMGGAGDVDKYPPNQPVAIWADQADAAAADGLPVMQGATTGQPQEIAALRKPGQLDFSLSGYIPPQRIKDEALKSFNEYSSRSEEEKKDFISDIPATGKAPEEGDKMEIWGMGTGTVIGPKAAPEPEEMEVTGKEVGITGGKPYKKLKQERKKKTPEEIKAEKEEQDKYNAWRKDYSTAKLMFQRNSQLRNILERAGGDITKLDFDIETVTNDANERVQVANIRIGDEVVGQLETTAPEGIMSEFQAYTAITGAPILFGEGSKWKFYKTESEEKPTAAAQPAAGGLPAVQAQAPAPAPAAPKIPEEAAGLQQIVAQAQAAKEVEQAKATENRIKAIDAEIKRLSPTTAGPQTRLQSEGLMPQKQKTPDEAQADIQKIIKLKAEKDALLGKTKTTKTKFSSKEDVIKAIRSGQLTREQGKTILQNQFGLQ